MDNGYAEAHLLHSDKLKCLCKNAKKLLHNNRCRAVTDYFRKLN